MASLALRPVLRTAVPSDTVPFEAVEPQGHRELITQPQPPAPTSSAARPGTTGASPAAPRTSAGSASSTPRPTTGAPGAPGAPARIVDGWTVTAGSDGVDVYLKSFHSEGGDAVIRIRAAVVSLVTATPRDGYSASKAQTEPTRLVVQFVAASGSSAFLIDCLWWQDAPHGEVTRIGT